MPGRGHTELDFGAFPGKTYATVDVTGQTGILSTSHVEAWLAPEATADHSADEHIIAAVGLRVLVKEVPSNGVGFTIVGIYRAAVSEPLDKPTPSTFRSAATTVYGDTAPSVGGQEIELTGRFRVGWVWV